MDYNLVGDPTVSEPGDLKHFRNRQQRDDENILGWAKGYIGKLMGQGKDRQVNGVLVVTDRRSVFYSKGLLSERVETIMHDKVSSVEKSAMLGHHTVIVHTSGNDLEFKCMISEQANSVYRLIDELKGGGTNPASAPREEDTLAKLERLGALRDRGILSDEEFAAEKAKLLAG